MVNFSARIRAMLVMLLLCALLSPSQEKIKKSIPTNFKENQPTDKSGSKALPAVTANSPGNQPTSHPDTEKQDKKSENGTYRIEVAPQSSDAWFKGYVIFTGVIAVINFGMLIVFWRQRKVMSKQLTEMQKAREQTAGMIAKMDENAVRQLRAYVCVSTALIKFARPDIPEAQIHIKNCGQTPAYDVRHWIGMWIEEYPLKVVLAEPPPDFSMSTALLAPGGESIMIFPKPLPVPPDSIKLLGKPEGTIFIYGKVAYKDGFGKERYTNYRLMYGGSEAVRSRTIDGVTTGMLKPDTDGNDAN